MKKLAVFVEGNTEVLFAEALVTQIAGSNRVRIERAKIVGGRTVPRQMRIIQGAGIENGQQYYVLLVDCGGDKAVKSRVMEEHDSLSKNGYEKIIAIRDVRPDFTIDSLPLLEAGLPKYIKTSLIPVRFVLAVLEIEAWFLSEYKHLSAIDSLITPDAVLERLRFDPRVEDMSQRSTPADDLDQCYQIAGKRYRKSAASTTIGALDYEHLYMVIAQRNQYLQKLVDEIDQFLT